MITQITNQAQLSRRTFYRHFTTIDDLLIYHLEKISEELAEDFRQAMAKSSTFEDYVVIYFSFWERNKNLLNLLQRHQLLSFLAVVFMPSVLKQLPTGTGNLNADYFFYFLFGGMQNLLLKWVEDGMLLTSKDIGKIASTIHQHWKD